MAHPQVVVEPGDAGYLPVLLARPERRNALDPGMVSTLTEAMSDAGDKLVLLGSGAGHGLPGDRSYGQPLSRLALDRIGGGATYTGSWRPDVLYVLLCSARIRYMCTARETDGLDSGNTDDRNRAAGR
jgi:hypothetical protein